VSLGGPFRRASIPKSFRSGVQTQTESALIAAFSSANLLANLGTCAYGSNNPHCSNPTPEFQGQDNQKLFVSINVFDLTCYMTKVAFHDSGATGFEPSNDAVASINPIHLTGILVTSVPGPASATVPGVGC
jgi:hypothetical protein